MGCTCSREGTKIIVNQRMPGLNQFIIKIHIPKSENVKILFYNSAFDKEPIIDLINFFFFNSTADDELDANFISSFNRKTDSFDYYIQRLAGYEIENESEPKKGKVWNCYINKEKVDWTYMCNNNRIISAKDELELVYEENETDVNNKNLVTSE